MGPPVYQSISSTVCKIGIFVPRAICVMHPIFPVVIKLKFESNCVKIEICDYKRTKGCIRIRTISTVIHLNVYIVARRGGRNSKWG